MSAHVDYLSPEWFLQADDAMATLSPIPISVVVAVNVFGLSRDRDDVAYRLVLGPDRVRIVAGELNDGVADGGPADHGTAAATRGDVTLTMSYEVATAIAQGEIGAQRAFLDGDVRLGGDTTALLGHQAQLAEVEDRLSDLRARTRY